MSRLYALCSRNVQKNSTKKASLSPVITYVTMTDGTGIVHIAPAFGEDDAKVGRKYDLPFVQFVNGKGEMTEETPYAGLFVKKADPKVLKDLDEAGQAYLTHQNSNMNIHTAGDVIHRLFTMQENPGSSR